MNNIIGIFDNINIEILIKRLKDGKLVGINNSYKRFQWKYWKKLEEKVPSKGMLVFMKPSKLDYYIFDEKSYDRVMRVYIKDYDIPSTKPAVKSYKKLKITPTVKIEEKEDLFNLTTRFIDCILDLELLLTNGGYYGRIKDIKD